VAALTPLRLALAKKLESVPGLLQASPYRLSDPSPPCAMVMGPGEISYDKAMQRGHDDWEIVVMAFVELTDDGSAQSLLDEFIAAEGKSSFKAVLETGDRTLGGVCDDLQVRTFSGYGLYQTEGRSLLGGEWTIRIIG
jgi:hypothetical protein